MFTDFTKVSRELLPPPSYPKMREGRRSRFSISTDSDYKVSKNVQTYQFDTSTHNAPITKFLTGSSYEGEWNILGMAGFGKYTFANGVHYEGEFRDGEFHGDGTLIYPMGQRVRGIWSNGNLVSWTYQFKDGLEFDKSWHYCIYPDRKFYRSIKTKLNPAGKERLTNDLIPRVIPPGCYDAGGGFYDPENKCIFSVNDHKKVLRVPIRKEADWIIENCRKAWDEPTKFKAELYPDWTTGRNRSTTKLLKKCVGNSDENMAKILNEKKPRKHIQIL